MPKLTWTTTGWTYTVQHGYIPSLIASAKLIATTSSTWRPLQK